MTWTFVRLGIVAAISIGTLFWLLEAFMRVIMRAVSTTTSDQWLVLGIILIIMTALMTTIVYLLEGYLSRDIERFSAWWDRRKLS